MQVKGQGFIEGPLVRIWRESFCTQNNLPYLGLASAHSKERFAGRAGWQKREVEAYFWVRHCARNCPLEILSSLHSHLLDGITEALEKEQLAQDGDGARHVLLAPSPAPLSPGQP